LKGKTVADQTSTLHPLQQLPLQGVRAVLRMTAERLDRYLWASRYGMTPQQAAANLGTFGGDYLAAQAAVLTLLGDLFPAAAASFHSASSSGATVTANPDGTLTVTFAAGAATTAAATSGPGAAIGRVAQVPQTAGPGAAVNPPAQTPAPDPAAAGAAPAAAVGADAPSQ
jgi:hypothetical protein